MSDWTAASFLAEAAAWIGSQVGSYEAIEQTHVQPWSTVLRVKTSEGPIWFKAGNELFEARLLSLLARVLPDIVPNVIAADPERGWLLMSDAGIPLREVVTTAEDLWRWEEILPRYAELQLAMSSHAGELRSMGVRAQPLDGIADALANLLERPELLLLDKPEGLTSVERSRLQSLLPEVGAMSSRLREFEIPETIQHDDLHDANVFLGADGYRVLDWGDACIAHPHQTLTVTLRSTAYRLDIQPGAPELLRMRDAYLEPFSSYGTKDQLEEAAGLAYRTGTLARALAWERFISEMSDDEMKSNVEAIPYGLRRFLEGGPVGSWR